MIRVSQTHIAAYLLGYLPPFELHPLLLRKRMGRGVSKAAQQLAEEKKDEAVLSH